MNKKDLLSFPKIPKDAVARLISEIATHRSEFVFFSGHSEERMLERDISRKQIFQALRRGSISRGPDWETAVDHGWRCRVTAISSGVRLAVVVKVIERSPDDIILVVTAFKT